MRMILATSNAHKIKEIKEILGDTLSDLELVPRSFDVVEDGKTYEENALKKAKFAFEMTKEPSVADDSGLVIYSLPTILGVKSARFMESKSYTEKNRAILEMMRNVPFEKRGARFSCVVVYYDGTPHIFEGVIEGRISYEARGNGGFGYDPIFMPSGYDKTMAELGQWEKNRISHRAQAFKKLADFLRKSGQ